MKKLDYLVIILCIFLGVFFLFQNGPKVDINHRAVSVLVNGEEVKKLDLKKNTEFLLETEYGENLIQIEDGKANILFSDCKNQLCVRHPPISLGNEFIICLPNRLIIEIVPEEGEDELDFINY